MKSQQFGGSVKLFKDPVEGKHQFSLLLRQFQFTADGFDSRTSTL